MCVCICVCCICYEHAETCLFLFYNLTRKTADKKRYKVYVFAKILFKRNFNKYLFNEFLKYIIIN